MLGSEWVSVKGLLCDSVGFGNRSFMSEGGRWGIMVGYCEELSSCTALYRLS